MAGTRLAGGEATRAADERDELEGYSARAYEDADAAAVLDLLAEAFGRRRDPFVWRWQCGGPPHGWSRGWVVEKGGEIVAHSALRGFRCSIDGDPEDVILPGDIAVAPDHRRAGVALAMYREVLAASELKELVKIGFPVGLVADAGDLRGFSRLGRLPQWVRWLTPAGFAESRGTRTARALAWAVPPALALSRLAPTRRIEIEELKDLGAEVDRLAGESAAFSRCIRIRDGGYLRWRWLDQPGSSWRILGARDGTGRLLGLAVIGTDPDERHAGAPTGRVVDLLAHERDTTTTLLRAAAAHLRVAGCAIVALELLDSRPWAAAACRRAGFVERGVGPLVAAGGTAIADDHPARSRRSWYLTRGDTDLS